MKMKIRIDGVIYDCDHIDIKLNLKPHSRLRTRIRTLSLNRRKPFKIEFVGSMKAMIGTYKPRIYEDTVVTFIDIL